MTYPRREKIDNIKKESFDITADEKLYNIMEKKYKLSSVVTDVIKESSVDCMQNTRDDIKNFIKFDLSPIINETKIKVINIKTVQFLLPISLSRNIKANKAKPMK